VSGTSSSEHVILSNLDQPVRFIFWTKGELLLILGPFLFGLFTDQFILGTVFALISFSGIRFYKKRFGKGKLEAVRYWYLPRTRQLKAFPPTYLRRFL
jgi:type IV conjugative transfer system protein TraL